MDYTGQRITVMGLGRFGGGVGVTQFLASRGAIVTVTDTATADQLADSVQQVEGLPGVTLVLGEHREQDFRGVDLVVANPAVNPTNPFLQIAHDAGVPVTTEIVLLVRELPNRLRTIGVTGSAGKSTTTAMIARILRKAFSDSPPPGRGADEVGGEGERQQCSEFAATRPHRPAAPATSPEGGGVTTPRVWLGGNIGGSLLPVVDQIRDDDWVVLELSSFMLHYLREEQWSPHIAVITNISPNHLDWHGTFEDYRRDKEQVLAWQHAGDHYVIGPGVSDYIDPPRGRGGSVHGWREASEDVVELHDFDFPLAVSGRQNLANAACACEACRYADPVLGDCPNGPSDGWKSYAESYVQDFAGLPHRLELIGARPAGEPASAGGRVRWFNDSKSTTPEAAVLGIEAFARGSVHVILGGYDKGSDLSAMCRAAAERCAGVYTIGATGDAIADAVESASPASAGRATVVRCGTLDNAVAAIRQRVKPGEVALLSPGCASWDQFDNFERRGERFVALVRGA